MQLEYSCEPSDLLALAAHQRQQLKVRPVSSWLWFAYIAVVFAAIAVHSRDVIGSLAMVICFLLLFIVVQKAFMRATLKKLYAPENLASLLGSRKFTANDDGFSEQTEFRQTHYRWNSDIHIATTRDHLFIYINRLQGFVIPARAFPEQQAFVLFTGELKDRARIAIQSKPGAKATF